MPTRLGRLLRKVRACRICEDELPLGPRPLVRGHATATLLIIGQAPGTRAHASGLPWDDPSGDRLRAWLGLVREAFYDEDQIAIMPMGLCYPGTDPRGGDLPPRPECAPLWHERLRAHWPRVRCTLLVGQYAQRHYLGTRAGRNLTKTVRAFRDYLPEFIPLPHPSWRNSAWLKRERWFEEELLPDLREIIAHGHGKSPAFAKGASVHCPL